MTLLTEWIQGQNLVLGKTTGMHVGSGQRVEIMKLNRKTLYDDQIQILKDPFVKETGIKKFNNYMTININPCASSDAIKVY